MKEWVKWLLLGLLSIAFGVFVLSNTASATLAVTTVTGVLLLLSGVLQIAGGFSTPFFTEKTLSIVMGVVMAFLGYAFMANPLEGAISLATLIVVLLVASGILRIAFAMRMRGTQFFWPMLTSGVLSLALAGYIAANFDEASVNLLGIILGVELLFNGAGLLALAFFLRAAAKELKRQ